MDNCAFEILFKISNFSKSEAILKEITEIISENDSVEIKNFETIFQTFLAAEEKESTNINQGFALPIIALNDVNKPIILVVRLKKPTTWGSDKNLKKINFLISIILPFKMKEKLDTIKDIAFEELKDNKKLLNMLNTGSKAQVISIINDIIKKNYSLLKVEDEQIKKESITKRLKKWFS